MEGAAYDHPQQRIATKTRLSLLLFCFQLSWVATSSRTGTPPPVESRPSSR